MDPIRSFFRRSKSIQTGYVALSERASFARVLPRSAAVAVTSEDRLYLKQKTKPGCIIGYCATLPSPARAMIAPQRAAANINAPVLSR